MHKTSEIEEKVLFKNVQPNLLPNLLNAIHKVCLQVENSTQRD